MRSLCNKTVLCRFPFGHRGACEDRRAIEAMAVGLGGAARIAAHAGMTLGEVMAVARLFAGIVFVRRFRRSAAAWMRRASTDHGASRARVT